jgi:dipeptidyl-peptidase 4
MPMKISVRWLACFVTTSALAQPSPAPPIDVPATRALLQAIGESAADGAISAAWLADKRRLWFVQRGELVLIDPAPPGGGGPVRSVLATAESLGAAAAAAGSGAPAAAEQISLSADGTAIRFQHRGKSWRVALPGRDLAAVPEAEARSEGLRAVQRPRRMFPINGWDRPEVPNPGETLYASFDGWNLALREPGRAERRTLTNDGSEARPWLTGAEILVGRGSEWNADGTRLVARQLELGSVKGVPMVDATSAASESVSPFRYWVRAGEPLPRQTLHVIDTAPATLGHRVALQGSDEADAWLAFLDWRPGVHGGATEVWFMTASRDFARITLKAANAITGASRVVWEEKRDDGFVFFPFTGTRLIHFTPDGRQFVLWSDRGGRFSLWLHDATSGQPLRRLTPEAMTVPTLLQVDARGEWAYAMAHADGERPADLHLIRTRLADGRTERLTREPGQHRVAFSPDGTWIVDTHSDLNRAPRTELLAADGRRIAMLGESRALSPLGLDGVVAEPFQTTLVGERFVSGVILKPPGFDPTRRYPVIERLYGGMQSSAVPRGWLGRAPGGNSYINLLSAYLREGFVVVALDGPGTPGRSREHQLATFGHWPRGIATLHAQVLAELAATRPWLDLSRIGIDGNSWGGFVGLHALVEVPRFYKAAALTVPQTDPLDHISWIEFQLGTQATNPDGYAAARVLHRVAAIEAPLLLVAGTTDANVPYSNTLKLVDALAEAGKPYELVLLPNANHGLRTAGGADRYPYAVARSVEFFKRVLGGPKER